MRKEMNRWLVITPPGSPRCLGRLLPSRMDPGWNGGHRGCCLPRDGPHHSAQPLRELPHPRSSFCTDGAVSCCSLLPRGNILTLPGHGGGGVGGGLVHSLCTPLPSQSNLASSPPEVPLCSMQEGLLPVNESHYPIKPLHEVSSKGISCWKM